MAMDQPHSDERRDGQGTPARSVNGNGLHGNAPAGLGGWDLAQAAWAAATGAGRDAAADVPAAPSLKAAIARARTEYAERDTAAADLRAGAELRLAALRDRLTPLYAEIPDEHDIFDLGLVGGERPRLFVDIIAFVSMSRDLTRYRFEQDTRNGRRLLMETHDTERLTGAIADYIGRRIVERERALSETAAMARQGPAPAREAEPPSRAEATPVTAPVTPAAREAAAQVGPALANVAPAPVTASTALETASPVAAQGTAALADRAAAAVGEAAALPAQAMASAGPAVLKAPLIAAAAPVAAAAAAAAMAGAASSGFANAVAPTGSGPVAADAPPTRPLAGMTPSAMTPAGMTPAGSTGLAATAIPERRRAGPAPWVWALAGLVAGLLVAAAVVAWRGGQLTLGG
jgi:hypothetical protein